VPERRMCLHLEGGRVAFLDSSHTRRTYGGVLEGRLTRDQAVELARDSADRMWGSRPTHLIEEHSGPSLAPWTTMYWLSSSPLKGGDGSHVIVIYFHKAHPWEVDPIGVLEKIPWDAIAKDWET
jgi:hypothetical protein